MELSRICMNQCIFKWRGKFFKQKSGLSIGNGFSPFAANVFMSDLESEASKQNWFPRYWARYVDDIIAIVKKEEVDEVLKKLNRMSPAIKFTQERQQNKKLPFLDVLIEVQGNKLSFDVYRKPQHVQRYIPSKSNHPNVHKLAAFESMIFRMFNTPLSKENFKKEEKYIYETAGINGYRKKLKLLKPMDEKNKSS
jgi:hypothetical protein